jgi:hypothetical protein
MFGNVSRCSLALHCNAGWPACHLGGAAGVFPFRAFTTVSSVRSDDIRFFCSGLLDCGSPSTCCFDKPLLWLVCSCCGCMSKTQLLGMCRLYKHHFAAHYSQGPNISPYYPAALGLVWVACTHHKISTQHYRYSLGHARHSMTTLQSQFDFRPHNEANPHCNAMQSAISPAQTNTPTTLIIAVHCYTTGQDYPIRSNHTHFHLDNSAVSGAALLFSFRWASATNPALLIERRQVSREWETIGGKIKLARKKTQKKDFCKELVAFLQPCMPVVLDGRRLYD